MENSQTTLDEPISLRDTIENAIDSSESQVAENTTSQEATEAPKTSRARDESGKFTKSQPDADVQEIEALEAQDEEKPAVKPRPSSWKKDYEEDWGKLDPRLQDYIQQREADYAKGVSTYKNQWDNAQPILEAMRQFEPTLRQNNMNPAQWIQNLGTAHQTLVYGNPEQKLQMFAQLANDYGVNLGQLTGNKIGRAHV